MNRIVDPNQVAFLMERMMEFTEQKWHLKLEPVRQRHWVIAATERNRHFEPDQAVHIARVLSHRNYHHLFAIASESVTPVDDELQLWTCLDLATSSEDLEAFSDEYAMLNFLIIPDDESFAILCTSEDYTLFTGPKDLVEELIGMDLKAARVEFRKYCSENFADYMMEIVERYEPIGE